MEQLSGVLIKTGSWGWVWLPFALAAQTTMSFTVKSCTDKL
jgi:hypothetical protein